MKNFRLFFRLIALFFCLLFLQGALMAQDIVPMGSENIDSAEVASELLVIESLANGYKIDSALFKLKLIEEKYNSLIKGNAFFKSWSDHIKSRCHYYTGNFNSALELAKTALIIRRGIYGEYSPEVADLYSIIGGTQNSLGQLDSALLYKEKSLNIWIKLYGKKHREVGIVLNGIGKTYFEKGDAGKAFHYYKQAYEIQRNLPKEYLFELSPTLTHLGTLSLLNGDFERAYDYLYQALKISKDLFGENHPTVGYSYAGLGNITFYQKKYMASALHFIKADSVLCNSIDTKSPLFIKVYINTANALSKSKEYSEADIFYSKAFSQVSKNKVASSIDSFDVYLGVGQSMMDRSKYHEAVQNLEQASKCLKRLNDYHFHFVSTFHGLGVSYYKIGEYEKGLYYLDKGMSIANHQTIKQFSIVEKNRIALSKAKLLFDGITKSDDISALEKISKILENVIEESLNFVGELNDYKSKTQLLNTFHTAVELALQTQYQLIKREGISLASSTLFNLSENSKAFAFAQSLQSSDALHYANIPDSLLTREYDLKIDITYYEKKKQEKLEKGLAETDTTVLASSSKLFDLRREYESLIERFERDYSDYHDLKYNLSTITVEEVQRELLRPSEALLEYFVGDSSIFVFVVKPDDYQVVEVKKDFPLEAWVDTLRHNIYQNKSTGAAEYIQAATNLYDKLVRPVESLLPERLIIIPDGVLGYVPFDALLTERPKDPNKYATHEYLLKKHQISYCYSATLLKKMRDRQHRREPKKEFTAFAPYYTGDVQELEYLQPFQFSADSLYASLRSYTPEWDTPLEASGKEVNTLHEMVGGDAYYGSEATEARFDSIAGEYRIVHLATHGIADNRVGDYSFLAFHILPDSIENELLYVRDLYNLELNADMVVLSACETGLGELQRGEGIISLARAFAYAGAKSIVNTLWKVDDTSTSELMVEFYSYLKQGRKKDEALRLAKLAFMKKHPRRALPFYWAGVIAVGDMARVW